MQAVPIKKLIFLYRILKYSETFLQQIVCGRQTLSVRQYKLQEIYNMKHFVLQLHPCGWAVCLEESKVACGILYNLIY